MRLPHYENPEHYMLVTDTLYNDIMEHDQPVSKTDQKKVILRPFGVAGTLKLLISYSKTLTFDG